MAARKNRWKKLFLSLLTVVVLTIVVGTGLFIYENRYRYMPLVFESGIGGEAMMATNSVSAPSFYMGGADFDESLVSSRKMMPQSEPGMIADLTYAEDGRVEAESEERHIIQTGDLSLIVESVQDAITSIKSLTEELNGFVSESNIREHDDQSFSGWISLRIPSDQFEEALSQAKDLAVRVENENTRADDVTEQVVDLQTRLLNLRTQEEQYREIMKQAYTVEDILQVTQQLNNVRQQIERLDAQLQSLQDRVSYSTLSINLVDEGDVEIFGIYWRPLFEVKQAFRNALENLTGSIDSIVALIFNIPVVLLWIAVSALLLWLGWKGLRWSYYKWFK